MSVEILKRDSLPLGGFAGLKEHRLIIDNKVGGRSDTWDGIGNFVYLADARFNPYGETRQHPHREIDVISVMVEGNIAHEGSLEHGSSFGRDQAQVQRAGGEGFKHNEINPDGIENRMIQLWVLPETSGEPAGYNLYDLKNGQLNRIYGGAKDQDDYMDSHTVMEVGLFDTGEHFKVEGESLIYITRGTGKLSSGEEITDGDLVKGSDLSFTASKDDVQIIVIKTEEN
ncbi:MAG: pilus assembly protein [Kordiimonadaceae bacterium]|nr:pilus assembly protein [Kordiimonadaceae bacterium]